MLHKVMFACMFICVYACMYVCICIFMCVCMQAKVYIHSLVSHTFGFIALISLLFLLPSCRAQEPATASASAQGSLVHIMYGGQ